VDFDAGWTPARTRGDETDEGRQFPLIPALRDTLEGQREYTEAIQKAQHRIVPWVFHRDGKPLKHFRRSCPLLSDFPHLNTIKSYAGLNKAWLSTTAQRAFFLVDKDGIIRGRWLGTVTDVFPTEPILEAARAIGGK